MVKVVEARASWANKLSTDGNCCRQTDIHTDRQAERKFGRKKKKSNLTCLGKKIKF